MKRTTRRGVQAAIAAVTVVAATIGSTGTASAQLLDDVLGDLLATVTAQFQPLQVLVDEAGGLGVFRNGTTNVVMIPAEKAGDIDAFQATLSSQLVGVVDEIRVSQFTTDALSALADQLSSNEGTGIGEEYSFSESYSPETDTYEIATDAPESVTAPLLAAYPGQLSTVYGRIEPLGRWNDYPTYSGGASITNGTGHCTGTVGVKDASGSVYMMTAAHCFQMSQNVYNGDHSVYVGQVSRRNVANDSELIYNEWAVVDTVGPNIWTANSKTGTSKLAVKGMMWVRVGYASVFASGQTSGNQWRGYVTKRGTNYCLTGARCVTQERGFEFGGDAGSTALAPGDSGGPIYWSNGTGAYVMGLVSAIKYDKWGIATNIGVQMSRLLADWNVSLVTS